MNPVYIAIGSACAVLAGIAVVWIMTRLKFPIAWIRKLSHLGSMALIIIIALLVDFRVCILIGLIFALMLLLIKLLYPPKALTTAEAKESYGEVLFFVGVAISALIADSTWHFIIPIAILGLADTAAYVVGRTVHSPKLLFSKTVAGSSAFAVVAFLLLLLVAPWWIALIGGVVTSLAELVGLRGSDNLSVPVVASLLLRLL